MSVLTDRQLEQYVQELRDQCYLARYALDRLRESVSKLTAGRDWYRAEIHRQTGDDSIEYGPWTAVDPVTSLYADAVISIAARVSRLLWPREIRGDSESRAWAMARAAAMRKAVNIDNDILLLADLRDSIEHYDERLDAAIRGQVDPRIVRRNITDHDWTDRDGEYRSRVLNATTLAYQIGPDVVALADIGGTLQAIEDAANDWFAAAAQPDTLGPGFAHWHDSVVLQAEDVNDTDDIS